MRMILVRHGESEWNRIHRYQGQLDAPLSEVGRQQATALAERLRNESFVAIYTSPLQRAANTADAIAQFHPDVPISADAALMEIHHGEWQGKYAHDIESTYVEELREWRQHPMRSQMPGGESFSNVLKRTLDFQERMLATHHGKTIVVSTHDVVLKILVAAALEMSMDRINRLWIANASITIIDYQEQSPFLVSLSDVCHLGHLATGRDDQLAI